MNIISLKNKYDECLKELAQKKGVFGVNLEKKLENITYQDLKKQSYDFIIISGSSGCGKSTIAKYVKIEKFPMVATRKMRPGEKNGVDYYFYSIEEFNAKKNNFWDVHERHGSIHAIDKNKLTGKIKQNKMFYMDKSVSSTKRLLNLLKKEKSVQNVNVLLIYILPPSFEDLYNRICKKDERPDENPIERLSASFEDMKNADFYNLILVNDDLSRIKKIFKKIL